MFHGRADLIAQGFIDIFIQAKFITLFSFLFGLGFAVQLTRAEARGVRLMSFYPRRLGALAVFGLIHGILIWWGDILLSYALAGLLLTTFRKRTQETVLRWATYIFLTPPVVMTGFYAAYLLGWRSKGMEGKPPDMAKIHSVIAIYSQGKASQIFRENLVQWKDSLPALGFAFYALFLFLLGLWVWRSGIVERLDEYKPLLRRVCAWCLPVGIGLNAFVVFLQSRVGPGKPTAIGYVSNLLYFPAAHVLSAGYAAGLAVLIQNPAWRKRLTPFAAIGRMALTDYLTQSVVCTVFYYSYTTGLYGRVGPAMGLVPTVALYSTQVAFSNWWLKRYRFGPMEWLWRGMTYGSFPQFRREPASAAELPMARPAGMPE